MVAERTRQCSLRLFAVNSLPRARLLAASAALPIYVFLNSVLGGLVTIAPHPDGFIVLWASSLIGDVVFVAGSIAAIAVGVLTKSKWAYLYAALIVWATFSIAATATLSLPTFGEGSSSPANAGNLGYWIVFTPVVGVLGIGFTLASVAAARNFIAPHPEPAL